MIVTGNGQAFCGGGDVALFKQTLADDGEPLKAAQAAEMGLFNAVIDGEADDFLPAVIARTQAMIACGAAAAAHGHW